MEQPTTIYFTDHEVTVHRSFKRPLAGPANLNWTRTKFMIPDGFDAPTKVSKWIEENTKGRTDYWHYSNPQSRDGSYLMVVRFEDKNEALMFKLKGGHQVWQNQ